MVWVSKLTFHNLHGRSLEKAKNMLMARFVECTKADVTLNNYLPRSKTLVFLNSCIRVNFVTSKPEVNFKDSFKLPSTSTFEGKSWCHPSKTTSPCKAEEHQESD